MIGIVMLVVDFIAAMTSIFYNVLRIKKEHTKKDDVKTSPERELKPKKRKRNKR